MGIKPPIVRDRYTHQLPGVYGQFGTGAGVDAFYIQSVLEPSQLHWVSLISDIRGSERWQVRDLFQRDVDNKRISESLLPYLQNRNKIKFFNPLTLTLLPMKEDEVLKEMPLVAESSMTDDGYDWKVLERKGHHRVRWIEDQPHYALLEWTDTQTKLVAIDGQHRLSALKRFLEDKTSDSYKDLKQWRIPIVIVSFRVGTAQATPPTVLDVVRSIFIYINTEAKQVSTARQILLSDESVNSVVTQELVQIAHKNDLSADRKEHQVPLLFYDWRGEQSEVQGSQAPAAVKSVLEISNWFEYYLLGEDFGDDQKAALDIEPRGKTRDLQRAFKRNKLTHLDSDLLRERANETVLPAICHLLENFQPYRTYVEELHALERKYTAQSDLGRHAFDELRFGTSHALESNRDEVKDLLGQIKNEIEQLKRRCLNKLIFLDIGSRGIVCALGALRLSLGTPDWMEVATWFTKALNKLYENKWLTLPSTSTGNDDNFLLHVAVDHNDVIINNRLNEAEHALGAYLQLLVLAYGHAMPTNWNAQAKMSEIKEELVDRLSVRIVRGFKKELRPKLRETFPDGGRPLTEAVNKQAEDKSSQRIDKFWRKLEEIERE